MQSYQLIGLSCITLLNLMKIGVVCPSGEFYKQLCAFEIFTSNIVQLIIVYTFYYFILEDNTLI